MFQRPTHLLWISVIAMFSAITCRRDSCTSCGVALRQNRCCRVRYGSRIFVVAAQQIECPCSSPAARAASSASRACTPHHLWSLLLELLLVRELHQDVQQGRNLQRVVRMPRQTVVQQCLVTWDSSLHEPCVAACSMQSGLELEQLNSSVPGFEFYFMLTVANCIGWDIDLHWLWCGILQAARWSLTGTTAPCGRRKPMFPAPATMPQQRWRPALSLRRIAISRLCCCLLTPGNDSC